MYFVVESGFGVEALPTADVERILSAFPRLKMKQRFAEACCRLVTARPETSHDNFLRDFSERFVRVYKAGVPVLHSKRPLAVVE